MFYRSEKALVSYDEQAITGVAAAVLTEWVADTPREIRPGPAPRRIYDETVMPGFQLTGKRS